jgi:hypothetical protein
VLDVVDVLEGLLEGQELEHRQRDRGVETDAALVGADRHAVLDAVAAVDLHLAVVVDPRHAEHDHALGLDQAVQQALLGVSGVGSDEGPQAFHHFRDGLQELRLARVAGFDVGEEIVNRCVLHAVMLQKSA